MAQEESANVISNEKNKQLKKKLESIIISAVIIVVGLLFCVLSTNVIEIIETVVLVGALIYGGVCMLIYCFTPADFRDNKYLIKTAICLGFGLLLIFIRSFFISAFGLLILVSGAKTALSARVYKAVGDNKWYMELLVGLFIAILGAVVILLSNIDVAKKVVLVILGVSLILHGLINYAFMFWLRAERENIQIQQPEQQASVAINQDVNEEETETQTQDATNEETQETEENK